MECHKKKWLITWAGGALNGATGRTFWSEGCDGREARAAYEKWWKQNSSSLV